MRYFILGVFLLVGWTAAEGQKTFKAAQFSGLVVTGQSENIVPVPYATIAVVGTPRGTYANYAGFFSIVVQPGEIIQFSSIGFKTVEYQVPDVLSSDSYRYVQNLTQDTVTLPEAVVFPWPSKRYLKQEFLAMDVSNDLQVRAQENLMKRTMEELRVALVADPRENANYYMREQAANYYHAGQYHPHHMSIFSTQAWVKFFQALKRGDFKKKKDK